MDQMLVNHQTWNALPIPRLSLRGCAEHARLSMCAARAGSWAWDLVTGEGYYSNELCEALGLDPLNSSSVVWIERLHPDDRERCQRELLSAIDEHRDFECEFRILRSDGQFCWAQGRGWILYDREGTPQRLIGLGLDITSRKEKEVEREELLNRERAAREAAEAANRGRDEFLALVSHELRTTLNAILSWSRILVTKRNDSEAIEEATAIIERCARMQARLVEDLLDTSCARCGKLRLEMEMVDLSKAIGGVIEMARPVAKSKGVELHFQPVFNLRRIHADPTRLQQIVWNLLTNAIKFTPQGGRVELRIGVEREHVLIHLRDTGQGITPDLLPHIFERFRQGPSANLRRCAGLGPGGLGLGGLGLGLALARDLVMLHGGTIDAESPGEGMGSTFTISLPYPARMIQSAASAAGPVVEKSNTEPSNVEARRLLKKLPNSLQVASF